MLRSSPPEVLSTTLCKLKANHTRTTAPKRDLNKAALQLY